MTESKHDEFLENFGYLLSESNGLKQFEKQFKQPITITSQELENPNTIIPFLNTIQDKLGIYLAKGDSPDFFLPAKNVESSFEQRLKQAFDKSDRTRITARIYIYLTLLSRKTMVYHFTDLNSDYAFDLRDIYHTGGIAPHVFTSVESLPNNIVKRLKIGNERYLDKARQFERQFIKLERQIESKEYKLQDTASSTELSKADKESKTRALRHEIHSLVLKLDDLSFKIKDEFSVTPRHDAPTKEDVALFIVHFIRFGINVEKETIDSLSNYLIKDENYTFIDTHNLMFHLTEHNIYFPNTQHYEWENINDALQSIVYTIAPTLNINTRLLESVKASVIEKVSTLTQVPIFAFKENCLFFSNGIMPLSFKDGHIQAEFKSFSDLTLNELMFGYPTNFRLDLSYNANAPRIFNNNPNRIDVTPKYIFNALGERGYIPDEKMKDKKELENFKTERIGRTNILMQYFLKCLLPFNDIGTVEHKMLLLYDGARAGKSTYIGLIDNIINKGLSVDSVSLQPKDFSEKSEFGAINVLGKRLIKIDEGTNGNTVLPMAYLKKAIMHDTVTDNVKNGSFMTHRILGDIIFASNGIPMFDDETEGTHRRILPMRLFGGYASASDNVNKGDKEELTFIQDQLIKNPDFQSACIRHAIEESDVSLPAPDSILNDALKLLQREDDVTSFINDELREVLDEPLIISRQHLYKLYVTHNVRNGRSPMKTRNIQNFEKALFKHQKYVRELKRVPIAKLDILNQLVAVQGRLFYTFNQNNNNSRFSDYISNHFIEIMREREREITNVYDTIETMVNVDNQFKGYDVSLAKPTVYVILPNNEIYNSAFHDNDTLKSVCKSQKQRFNKRLLTKENVRYISNHQYDKLPLPLSKDVSYSFNSYREKESDVFDTHTFSEFIYYTK